MSRAMSVSRLLRQTGISYVRQFSRRRSALAVDWTVRCDVGFTVTTALMTRRDRQRQIRNTINYGAVRRWTIRVADWRDDLDVRVICWTTSQRDVNEDGDEKNNKEVCDETHGNGNESADETVSW